MNFLQRLLALFAGKVSLLLLRLMKAGGGTTLPGRVALAIYPQLLTDLGARLDQGVILVTGTNGKTTSTRMMSDIFAKAGCQVLHNRAGANLLTGVASAMVRDFSLSGQSDKTIGLFEADEAHLPALIHHMQPRRVVIHNLFRDQLDRYGEIDTLLKKWKEALGYLPAESLVLLNGDDPGIASLRDGLSVPIAFYGMENPVMESESRPEHTADSQFCKRCGAPLTYERVYYGHIGSYRCPSGDFRRPDMTYSGEEFRSLGMAGFKMRLVHPLGDLMLESGLPGLYNGYNALAAASLALSLGIEEKTVSETLKSFHSAFGRLEKIIVGKKTLIIALIKNPVGTNEVLRLLAEDRAPKNYLVAINDKIADGTDVSWLWDADFEKLAGSVSRLTVSGTRAYDMALRLKYGDIDLARVNIESDLSKGLEDSFGAISEGETLYLLATYTAMLELQEALLEKGYISRPYWER